MIKVLVRLFLLLMLTDLPRVLARSSKIYLPRGMLGKIECPVDANPPVTLILWSKNEKMIDTTQMTRMRVTKQGALIIKSVIQTDEGRYACTPYSPLGAGKNSMPVQVYVKGEENTNVFCMMKMQHCCFKIFFIYLFVSFIAKHRSNISKYYNKFECLFANGSEGASLSLWPSGIGAHLGRNRL